MARYGFNIGLDGHRIQPLTEKEAEEIADGLTIIYGEARERMLKSVADRVARGVTRYGWAERKANEVLGAHAQLSRDLDRAHAQRESLLSGVIDRAYATGSQQFYADMRSILGDSAHISPNSMKTGYILADLNNSLNAAERRILRQFDDRYADVIGAVSSELATGDMTAKQAVGEALQRFADQGITGFIDRGGHHWTLESYSEMAVLTAIERSTISGYVDTMQSYGYDLAVIDGHIGSCPICEAWEGVIISVSGNDPNYPSLNEAEGAGCFHPRCMHGIHTYYEGITHAPAGGFRDAPREMRRPSVQYSARSKQRYMERMIRKYKDRLLVAVTSLQRTQAQAKVKEWQDALDAMIENQPSDNYLYRHKDRESSELGRRFTDVSDSYTNGYTPGIGTVSKEPGYSDPSKGHETKIAEGLNKSIGGDILHIDNSGSVTKPDVEWHGKAWEIKNTSSVTSIDTQTRKGLDQIATYHGNLIVDNTGTAFDLFQQTVMTRVQRSAKEDVDIVLFYDGQYVKILRYKKR